MDEEEKARIKSELKIFLNDKVEQYKEDFKKTFTLNNITLLIIIFLIIGIVGFKFNKFNLAIYLIAILSLFYFNWMDFKDPQKPWMKRYREKRGYKVK